MKLNELQELIRAGFTKAEIMELTKEDVENSSDENVSQDLQDVSQDKHEEKIDFNAFENLTKSLDNLNLKIKELDASIKKGNILSNSIDAPKQDSADKVLAQILSPLKKED